MPIRRRRGAPLKSDKHEVPWSNLAQDASSVQSITLATGVASADKNAATEVEVGSHIRNIYLEMNIAAETITNPKVFHWEVRVAPQQVAPASLDPALYYQNGRNTIIKRGMEMLPKDVSTVFKRIVSIRIPRKSQRFGANDALFLNYKVSSAEAINFCGFAIYKELY